MHFANSQTSQWHAPPLRQMVGRPILLSVPTCDILARKAAIERRAKPGNPNLVAVRQDFRPTTSDRLWPTQARRTAQPIRL
jgi:hypothetical protein